MHSSPGGSHSTLFSVHLPLYLSPATCCFCQLSALGTAPTAGMHRAAEGSCMCAGETWQATLGDGSKVYFEQISHHPPVSAFQLIGPGASWPPCSCMSTVKAFQCIKAHATGDAVYGAQRKCSALIYGLWSNALSDRLECLQMDSTSIQGTRSQRSSTRAMR